MKVKKEEHHAYAKVVLTKHIQSAIDQMKKKLSLVLLIKELVDAGVIDVSKNFNLINRLEKDGISDNIDEVMESIGTDMKELTVDEVNKVLNEGDYNELGEENTEPGEILFKVQDVIDWQINQSYQ